VFFKLRYLTILIVCLSTFSANGGVNLPAIGVDSVYQLQKEKEIGQTFYQRLLSANKIINDPLVNHYIQEITHILLQGLDRTYRAYKVSVIDDPAINAFAVPGGFIGVNYGLIFAAETEAQLAGVLAHEIAHIKLRHIYQMINKQSDVSTTVLASILLALIISQSSESLDKTDAIEAIVLGGSAGAQQSLINFTRENEYEADRKGLEIMKKSGYPALGMAEFFSILEGKVGGNEIASIEYLRTHPVSENRMGEAYQFRTHKPRREKKSEFEYLKVYLSYIIEADLDLESKDKSVVQFQQALRLLKINNYVKAKRILLKLHGAEAENSWVNYLLIQEEIRLGNLKQALVYVQKALVINPNLSLWLASKMDIFVLQKNYQGALKLALGELLMHKDNQAMRYKLVNVYEKMGRAIDARAAEADYHFNEGNYARSKYLYQLVIEKTHDRNQKKGAEEKINKIKKIEASKV